MSSVTRKPLVMVNGKSIPVRPSHILTLPRASDLGDKLAPQMIIETGPGMDELGPNRFVNTAHLRAFYDDQAAKVVEAMLESLPQGLTDRILARLLDAKASDLFYAK